MERCAQPAVGDVCGAFGRRRRVGEEPLDRGDRGSDLLGGRIGLKSVDSCVADRSSLSATTPPTENRQSRILDNEQMETLPNIGGWTLELRLKLRKGGQCSLVETGIEPGPRGTYDTWA